VNLGQLIDFVGNLLDYDPTNDTYRTQLVSILNDSQTRILTDRPWDFGMKERKLKVWTDTTFTFTFTNGADQVAGVGIPVSGDPVLPGSNFAFADIEFVDSGGVSHRHVITWVKSSTVAFLDRPYPGATGAYVTTIKRRDVFLPSDCLQVQNVGDPSVGIPAKAMFLSKFEREDANLDAALLGVIEAYLPSDGRVIPAPNNVRGVSVVVGVGQGVRTVNVYMLNVTGPNATNWPIYPRDVSNGWESSFSKVQTFALSDVQTLQFKPEPLDPQTGLWRRYYFTCPEAGILAPVRIRHTEPLEATGVPTGTDTVAPDNPATALGIVLLPRLELSHLSTQSFQASSVRFRWNQSAAYRSVQLYPHPSGDQDINVRQLVNPSRLQEDQDAPLIPNAYAQLIAYAALESLALKVDNPSLSAVYSRKKDLMFRGMEQAYLKAVPRRIIKGTPTAGYRFVRNPFGPLSFS
tara:strand:- start:8909 stop:10297 length:1389 start_codon:yes stop_codon:yes gene_type:complete